MSNPSIPVAQINAASWINQAYSQTHDIKFNNAGEAYAAKKPGVEVAESGSYASRQEAARMSRYK